MSTDKIDIIKPKIVLFIGNADSEGVTAKLKTVGTFYKRKMLESKPENWKKIISVFNEYDVTCVVAKLTNTSFRILCHSTYKDIRKDLLELIATKPNLFLAHESILSGEQAPLNTDFNEYDPDLAEDYEYEFEYEVNQYFVPPPTETTKEVIDLLSSYGISIVPYKKNVELVVIASRFVEKNESNLIFRIYVPSERMWANEAEKLLQLFREYLQKVSGLNVRHDQYRTNQGVVYEFFGGDSLESGSLPEKFNEFSTLDRKSTRLNSSHT